MSLTPKEEAVLDLIRKDLTYENYFFKKVTDIKWFYPLKEKGFFSLSKLAGLKPAKKEDYFIVPFWNILPYLEQVSQQINIPGNEKYIDELLTIIKEVSNYRDENNQHIDNYYIWYYFVKILCNIPNNKIPIDIIKLIPIWLDSKFNNMLQGAEIATKLLPKFLTDNSEDIQKAESIIKSITAIIFFPLSEEQAKFLGKKEDVRLVINSYWLKEAFDKYSEIIGQKCSKSVVEDLISKIKNLLTSEIDLAYYSLFDKLADELEFCIDEPKSILNYILKRVLLSMAKNNINDVKDLLNKFLIDKYLYFPKMALYIISQNVDSYEDLFWEVLNTEAGNFILENTLYLGDELKHLLKNLRDLSDEQKEMLNLKIERAAEKIQIKEQREKYIARYKQEIYQALSHDSYFKNRYDEIKKISGVDAELQPAIKMEEPSWVIKTSPLTKEEIIKIPNDKLSEFLVEFRTRDEWEGPSIDGLSDVIYEVAKEMPDKFIDDLNSFKNTGFIYVYEILRGVKDALNEKKIIEWNKVLEFIEFYIGRKEFWEDKFIVEKGNLLGGADHHWIVGIVAELIQYGTRGDERAIPEQLFEKAKKLIFLILDNLKVEEDKEITDYVTYTINTSSGKVISALILLALRIALFSEKKGILRDIKWEPEFKKRYDELLNIKIIEGFFCLGRYLSELYYLDREWVKEKIKNLENEKGNKYWEAFMQGYLSTGKVYGYLYNLMNSHYEYGLSYNFKTRRNIEFLIQHICLGYLHHNETLDDSSSLFKKLIDLWNPAQIKEIIRFFWMQRNNILKEIAGDKIVIERILQFWNMIYEKYKDKNENLLNEDKQILSAISELALFLPQIDEKSFKWLKLSARYVNESYVSPFFIEYLEKLKDKGDNKQTAKYIGEIFLEMLKNFTPWYKEEHILSIVEFLYSSNESKYANEICNEYAKKGHEFLKEIYNKYNLISE
ncbi:hypothetical protein [Rosettibacter firmus]|uniref:hypothetical protein n=1 Tax=Rosettibacter firmus TaxID=3111522 RepID=UPI00336C04F2